MPDFVPGQRWINSAEPELGLGIVIEVEHRRVTMLFMAAEDSRVYAIDNTPLTRIKYKAGDIIRSQKHGELKVQSLLEDGGLISYQAIDSHGTLHVIPERDLDHTIQLHTPVERLFSEQLDKNQWFELRYQLLDISTHFQHSDLFGLSGSRTALLPHQLYIAHEVGKRYAPRVLLADEVGLGKTIEAGMILLQQILRGHIQRVLIVVPETLQHQWLVEMLRRFNLSFSLLDEPRLEDELEYSPEQNPFLATQMVISNLHVLTHDRYQQQVIDGEWDMIIVDEAHHLEWNPQQAQPEYAMVETLAKQTPSVLLLTATPEQLGKESHFARLRLLDSNRFHDYQAFLDEEASYEPIAAMIECLLSETSLTPEQLKRLETYIKDQALLSRLQQQATEPELAFKQELTRHLLDQQGTGRLLFRNTRTAIEGFPNRNVVPASLVKPQEYDEQQASLVNIEQGVPEWCSFDPRMPWLLTLLKDHPNEKFLLITSFKETALDISEWLRVKHGIHAPVFHEQMSIIERDRVAAFFADEIDGCQLLLCSEIGGEGRNFQFARRLVLFELPMNPDLLEQRIGRIDRIGQGEDIFIHIPVIENTAQVILFEWYHHGLNALNAICPAAAKIYAEFQDQLQQMIAQNQLDKDWMNQVQQQTSAINLQLQSGRDRLLEYNSFDHNVAEKLLEDLSTQQDIQALQQTLELLFDCYGVDHEQHSEQAYVIKPSNTMTDNFPMLDDEGMTITYDRNTALKYDNMSFITWEHPMVIAATDMVMVNERGNTAVSSFSHKLAKEGLLFIECLFSLDLAVQHQAYLSGSLIRVLLAEDMKDYSKAIQHGDINQHKEYVNLEISRQIIKSKRPVIEKLIRIANNQAEKRLPPLQQDASQNIEQILGGELRRLEALADYNPNIRQQEIEYFQTQYQQAMAALENVRLRLDAIRVLVAT